MNPITPSQQRALVTNHALGYSDRAIASLTGVSLATVKRYRRRLGLETKSVTAQLGKQGESLLRDQAKRLGYATQWRDTDNAPHDLSIQGVRVDVKTTLIQPDGSWRFRLPRRRHSHFNRYVYRKDYERDCEVVAFVCLRPFGDPDIYFIPSAEVPTSVVIRPGGKYERFRNDWSPFHTPLAAAA